MTNVTLKVCSCGKEKDHIIAKRATATGEHVYLWSTGELTWALGFSIKGAAHPTTPEQQRLALRAGWLVLGEVCLYDHAEVPALVAAARWTAKRDGLPGTMRRRLHAKRKLSLTWITIEANRDGKPVVRFARLNRMTHPGQSIWHDRGQYHLMFEVGRTGTCAPTGIKGPTLKSVLASL